MIDADAFTSRYRTTLRRRILDLVASQGEIALADLRALADRPELRNAMSSISLTDLAALRF